MVQTLDTVASSPAAATPADAPVAAPASDAAKSGVAAPPPAAAAHPSAPAESDVRLTIEREDNVFVYKIFDRQSGQLIASIPREDVQEKSADPDYRPGNMISAWA